jgi:hypothetical protein
MKYPLSDNTDQYQGKIQFLPIVEDYIDLASTAADVAAAADTGISQFNSSSSSANSGGPGYRSSGSTSPLPSKITSISRTNYGQKSAGPITLYLPQAININDGVNYENLNLGIIGANALAAVQSGKGIKEAMSGSLKEAANTAYDFVANRSGLGSQLAGLAAVRLADKTTEGYKTAARSAFGVSVNPNTRALFNSVNLRDFSFSFKMIASSQAEALEIDNIIKAFRTELYPREIEGPGGVPVGYIYPNKFRILMTYRGQKVATKFLDSNIISVNTVYNPSSMGWHFDGKPSEVDLTLSFREARTMSKKYVEAGY